MKNCQTHASNIYIDFLKVKLKHNRTQRNRKSTSPSSVNAVECHPPAAISTYSFEQIKKINETTYLIYENEQ